jgi:chemotaxis protein histidine kinase CheA
MGKAGRTATVAPPQGTFTKSLRTQVDAGVGSLARTFLERTRGDVVRLRSLVECARQGETSVLDEVGRLTHSIHGTGAMFGYRGVSAAAGSIEACVGGATAMLSTPASPGSPGSLGLLLELMERLAQETEMAAQAAP